MRAPSLLVAIGSATLILLVACSSDETAEAPTPTPTPTPEAGPEEAGPAPAPGGSVSGSRLKIRTYDATDGTVVIAEIYDSKLNVRCIPRKMGGSAQLRCVPDVGVGFYGGVFGDSTCVTVLPVAFGSSCENAKFALTNPADPCADVSVFPVTGTATTLYNTEGGGCVKREPNALGSYRTVGPQMAATEFVAFTPVQEALSPELSLEVLVGDDGSRIVASAAANHPKDAVARLIDKSRNAACAPRFAADDTPRCLPFAGWDPGEFENAYSDTQCAALSGSAARCVQPGVTPDTTLYARGTATGQFACEPDKKYAVHKAIPSINGVFYMKDDQGACKEEPPVNAADLVSKGDEIPASSLPKLDFGKVAGGSRLTVSGFTVGGKLIEQGRIRDNETGMDCTFRLAVDGSLRCLPIPMFGSFVYADATCTQKALVPTDPLIDTCNTPTYARFDETERDCGDEKLAVYKVGTKIATSNKIYDRTNEGCKETPLTGVSFVYPLLEEAPPSTFVEAKVVQH